MNKSERTKSYIIETAATIFNKKGYEGTSLSDIIESTGLTKGAIYGHFQNKDDLASEVLEHNLELASKIIFSNVKEKIHAYDKLIAFSRSYSIFFDFISKSGGCPVINAAVDFDDGHTLMRKKVIKFITMWQNSIQKIINEGIEKGELRPSPLLDDFSKIFVPLVEGAIMLSKVMNDRKYIDNASDYLVSIVEKIKG